MLVVGGVVHQEGWHRGVPAQHELEVTGAVRDLPAEDSLERSDRFWMARTAHLGPQR
jgi:hypothetical protein